MRILAPLLLSLCLPAQAAPCTLPDGQRCPVVALDGIVRGKDVLDPLTAATQAASVPFVTDKGAKGTIDSVVADGVAMLRIRVDKDSRARVAALTVTWPGGTSPRWALLLNAPDGLPPDWALQDLLAPRDYSFAFANGLAPGEVSSWLVDAAGAPGFALAAPGHAVDMRGTLSAERPLLGPAP